MKTSKQHNSLAILSLLAATLASMQFLTGLVNHSTLITVAAIIPTTISIIFAIKADNELKKKYRNPVKISN